MNKLFVEDLNVKGKKVISRVDFNVPLNNGIIQNDKRLRASLPTIKYLQGKGAKLILMSHLGRPKGQVVESMSLAPVAQALGKLLGRDVKMAPDCIGDEVSNMADALDEGEILLLENLRFHKGETDNDEGFAKQLASLADVYVNDAFGTAHRAHASTEGITKNIDKCACGYLLKKEIDFLGNAVQKPEKPFVAIIGGAKISGKIDVIKTLLPKVDKLLIGGAMAFTFLKSQGHEIGESLCEDDKVGFAGELIKEAGDKIELPVDSLVTDKLDFEGRTLGKTRYVGLGGMEKHEEGVDIGPETASKYADIIKKAKTILWNGPMGVFEIEESSKGTFKVADALAEATAEGAISIIGGGDSASAISKANLESNVSHVSTGGGASLEFLEGKQLPGVVALTDK